MKHYLLHSLIFLLIISSLQAQDDEHGFDKEKLKAKKVAFLTNKLDLTVEEAQQFWPVYNKHENQQMTYHQDRRKIMKKIMHEKEDLSDEKLLSMIDELTQMGIDEAKDHKKFVDDIKKILPAKKLVAFFEAEREFKHSLLKEYGGRHRHGRGHGGPMHN